MANSSEDTYVRRNAIITLLWLVGMLVAGLLLINFGDLLQSVFT
jgi:hypothetical protein